MQLLLFQNPLQQTFRFMIKNETYGVMYKMREVLQKKKTKNKQNRNKRSYISDERMASYDLVYYHSGFR